MLLTIQQKYYLDAVRELECLRTDQLHALLKRQFHMPGKEDVNEYHMAAMFRQLRYCNWDIHQEGGYVYISEAQPNQRLLESIDVMLELSQQGPLDFKKGHSPPAILRFSLGGDTLRLFTVASLSAVGQVDMIERQKMERIIWISDDGQMPKDLALPPKQFFAVREEDGSHRFYGSAEL